MLPGPSEVRLTAKVPPAAGKYSVRANTQLASNLVTIIFNRESKLSGCGTVSHTIIKCLCSYCNKNSSN
jgi:hypothetical protein